MVLVLLLDSIYKFIHISLRSIYSIKHHLELAGQAKAQMPYKVEDTHFLAVNLNNSITE